MREDEKTSNNSIRDTEQVPSNSLILSRNDKEKRYISKRCRLYFLSFMNHGGDTRSPMGEASHDASVDVVKSVANSVVNIYYVAEQRRWRSRRETRGRDERSVAPYENKERARKKTREPRERVVPVGVVRM